ncbi:hypothetical protein [Sediminicurvatus halobius]|uniref:Uncharacterized protein n=1 Tax=Sediminicurvatus halobius TaxID=2182432 RepID=A0A2U2N035_9GAMM|nr:hypothetical protein [Spiribacter halobius]PWG62490.1 hypothetical protein DEM34_11950 [Spiribacter halobius]UEX78582.1 hypothetical protein LMH63_02750 [Spiribacter halobius]
MDPMIRTLRIVGWVFLAIAVNVVAWGVGTLWLEAGPAGIQALLDPANAVVWITTLLTFAPAVASFYAAYLLKRREQDD